MAAVSEPPACSVNGVGGLTAMVYVSGPAVSPAPSFTVTLVKLTVPTVVGVPLILSVLPPLLETEMLSEMATKAPVVGTAVPLIENT